MPLQNRVSPFGAMEAVPARGTLMGNRGGALHDSEKRLGTARWRGKRWLACVLAFKGRHRTVMTPRRYTELFFLDEAVSLAAGHRPCCECRRGDYRRFLLGWRNAHELAATERLGADTIDDALHASRVTPRRQQVRFRRSLTALPDGTFVSLPDETDTAWLVWRDALCRWSHAGYGERRGHELYDEVDVLTPIRTVEVLAAGYTPSVHPSAVG